MSKPKVGQIGLSRSLLLLYPAPLIALSTIPLHLQRGWTKKSAALSQLASLLLQCNNWTTFSCWLENLCWLVALLVLHCSVPGWLPSPVASHPCYLLPPWSFLHPFRSPILLRIPSAILVLLAAVPFSPSQACPSQSRRSTAAGAPLYLREHHSKMIKLKTAKREKSEILLKSLHNFCPSVSSYSPNCRKNIYL